MENRTSRNKGQHSPLSRGVTVFPSEPVFLLVVDSETARWPEKFRQRKREVLSILIRERDTNQTRGCLQTTREGSCAENESKTRPSETNNLDVLRSGEEIPREILIGRRKFHNQARREQPEQREIVVQPIVLRIASFSREQAKGTISRSIGSVRRRPSRMLKSGKIGRAKARRPSSISDSGLTAPLRVHMHRARYGE